MKQFGKILKFELKNYMQNKIFVGITVFLVVVITVVMFMPRIINLVDNEDEEIASSNVGDEAGDNVGDEAADNVGDGADGDSPIMLIIAAEEMNTELILKYFSEAFGDYNVKIVTEDIETVKSKITDGEIECAFYMKDMTNYIYYVNNLSMYDSNVNVANELLQNVYKVNAMLENGMTIEQAGEVMSIQVNGVAESLGKDQMENFFYTYIMIFALYIVILLYGQMVATNVATEKSSRAMELLVTSAKPTAMMFGKVFASCIAGLSQLIVIFGSALIFYNVNQEYWADNMIIKSIFDMPVYLFIYMLIFFILGFFVYAFLFGAVGSTASRLEDINTSSMPITLLFVAGFFVVMFSMGSGDFDSTIMKVCSYIPFTSPMAMFTRIAMTTVATYEIIISIIILVASVVGIGVAAAKIYRVGVLMYGTPPKFSAIIKTVIQKDGNTKRR